MQQHLLTIKANNQPATLERLLRVVRFRGFSIDRVSMHIAPVEQQIDIQVAVKSKRPIALLENQLRKLVDVQQVLVEQTQMARAQI